MRSIYHRSSCTQTGRLLLRGEATKDIQQCGKSRSKFKVPDVNPFTDPLVHSATAPCEMSVHLLFDSRGRPAFVCRVIHSAVLQLSCVQVINKAQRVVSVAYLIRENVLPKRGQVKKPDKCCTLDVQEGERAILIRGSKLGYLHRQMAGCCQRRSWCTWCQWNERNTRY